jgi:hypothetical protein
MMVMHYTARIIQTSPEIKVEVCKWNSNGRPENVYNVYPKTNSCDCISMRRDCKHVRLAKDLLDPDFINEMHSWAWNDKDGWVATHDIPIREFTHALLTS